MGLSIMIRTILMIALIGIPHYAVAKPCFSYGDDSVVLTGKVIRKAFFGPPGYGENPKTDRRETQGILLLAEPICVEASADEDAEKNQLSVTLVPLHNEHLRN